MLKNTVTFNEKVKREEEQKLKQLVYGGRQQVFCKPKKYAKSYFPSEKGD